MKSTLTFFWLPVDKYLDENKTVFRRFLKQKYMVQRIHVAENTGIYNQLMTNITKQLMNKGLCGRTYEKTGYW